MAGDTSPIPAARFGRRLYDTRTAAGLTVDVLATASVGRFDADELRALEAGEPQVDQDRLASLADLYQLDVHELTAKRTELAIDLDAGTVAAGAHAAAITTASDDTDGVLQEYLALVCVMRGLEPGTPVPIRQLDIDALARALHLGAVDVERALHQQMAGTGPSVSAHRRRRRQVLLPLTGVLVAVAVGAFVLVWSLDGEPGLSPSVTQAPSPAPEAGATLPSEIYGGVRVPTGETSVEVPPIVLERADPDAPAGAARVVEPDADLPPEPPAAEVEGDPYAPVPVEPGQTEIGEPLVLERE